MEKENDFKKIDVQTTNKKTNNVIEHENKEEKNSNVLKAEKSYQFESSANAPKQEFSSLKALPERQEENKETNFEYEEFQMEKISSQVIHKVCPPNSKTAGFTNTFNHHNEHIIDNQFYKNDFIICTEEARKPSELEELELDGREFVLVHSYKVL